MCLFIPFLSFAQSTIEEKLFGVWELNQENQFIKSERFNRNKITFEFKENGICRYTILRFDCIWINSKIIETKWTLKDSILTLPLLFNSELDTINVQVKEVTREYLILE